MQQLRTTLKVLLRQLRPSISHPWNCLAIPSQVLHWSTSNWNQGSVVAPVSVFLPSDHHHQVLQVLVYQQPLQPLLHHQETRYRLSCKIPAAAVAVVTATTITVCLHNKTLQDHRSRRILSLLSTTATTTAGVTTAVVAVVVSEVITEAAVNSQKRRFVIQLSEVPVTHNSIIRRLSQ